MKNKIPIIKGDRICLRCKGICHEDSFRYNAGIRKSYFCSEGCLLRYFRDEYNSIPSERLINDCFERVKVIAK